MNETVVEPAKAILDLNEKIRVLHVDDDEGVLKITKQCLELEPSIEVDTAVSVEEAFQKLEKGKFDVVVSDYQMPEKDGLDFLKILRNNGSTIPFIMFTGKGREEVAIKALNLGADQYLNKVGETETVYVELAHNITELAKLGKTKEELKVSEEKYRNLFENSKDLKVMYDLRGNITAVNKVALEYDFKTNEGIGRSMLEFVPEIEFPRLRKEVEKILQGETVEGEIEIDTPKGKRTFEYVSSPIRERGEITGIYGSYKDVTDRKKAEEQNRESEKRYMILANSLPEIVFEADLQGKLTFVNEKAFEMSKFTRQDFEKGLSAFDFFSPEEQEKVRENFRKRLQGESGDTNEYTFQRKDGSTYPVLVKSEPALKGNTVIGVRGIVMDISLLKKTKN